MSRTGVIRALGAMSGTSLDGVDAAVIETDGSRIAAFGESRYRPYSEAERKVLRAALGKIQGAEVEAAAEVVEIAHVELLDTFPPVDVVGFHGQTLTHLPDRAFTLQAGNGQVLAEALNRTVVWDFRSADMGLGGQGAPLAPFYHFALARHMGETRPVAFLNLGGVGNITWVDPRCPAPQTAGACLAFDTGPGNAPIDDLAQARRGLAMDEDGALTQAGSFDEEILGRFMAAQYLARVPPKSLDRNDFSDWLKMVADLSDEDAAATLAAGAVGAVIRGLDHCPSPPSAIYVAGGGRKNPGLMAMLSGLAPCPVRPVEARGLDGDMLEAQAFAFLAVRVLRGLATSAPGTTGVATPVGGGRISKPMSESRT